MEELYFVTANQHKFNEAARILRDEGILIRHLDMNIAEIQSSDLQAIAKNKALQAYERAHRFVFVEHTGLFIKDFGELPGGLTQTFWDALQADKFCAYFGQGENTEAVAKTVIGYCDGRTFRSFFGEIKGRIASTPSGSRAFQWDCVFIPEGYAQTFAEMSEAKHEISMRRIALRELSNYLKEAKQA